MSRTGKMSQQQKRASLRLRGSLLTVKASRMGFCDRPTWHWSSGPHKPDVNRPKPAAWVQQEKTDDTRIALTLGIIEPSREAASDRRIAFLHTNEKSGAHARKEGSFVTRIPRQQKMINRSCDLSCKMRFSTVKTNTIKLTVQSGAGLYDWSWRFGSTHCCWVLLDAWRLLELNWMDSNLVAKVTACFRLLSCHVSLILSFHS